ncbi:alpha/beta hydrolase [Acuticoccus sp. MNP-M23]|uniref:alpha/beta fold hydrolase n=1 Tax=Acuticoccus sp. MNP-M23 TaxID=3072793 RepID=UPI0028155089|nr:alpha/beta hydrolase [Acuticoccus sp. MNP-M23]WMS44991.1 alpha/beta hydrolase [Acuticoccus sp. MNP-M23]
MTPRELTAKANDGVLLHAEDRGPQSDPCPVICLPGLTRNARDFTAIADVLATTGSAGEAMRVLSLDSRGRGRSGRSAPETYTLPQEMADLLAAMDAFKIPRARFVGTSRGGLLVMLLAMFHPERIDRVVLNDIGPRIEPAGLARIGENVGTTMRFASFEALGEALSATQQTQFPRLRGEQWVRFARQLASSDAETGDVVLDYDEALAAPFRQTNSASEPPDFWPAFDALKQCPVLVLRGAHSDLLSAATVESMRRCHRRLGTFVASGEGHAPLLWDRASIETVKRFLAA